MRMNFEFLNSGRVLKKLLNETRTDMKDLVNNAFTILEWAVDDQLA